MANLIKYILPIFALSLSLPAIAAEQQCARELDDTYNITDEGALEIALQNLGLCLELTLYPKDVKDFLSREAICIHIAGEEPYSGERAIELERLNKSSNCDAIASQKETLLKKYRKDTNISRALKNYGNKIYPGGAGDSPADQMEAPPGPPSSQQNNEGSII